VLLDGVRFIAGWSIMALSFPENAFAAPGHEASGSTRVTGDRCRHARQLGVLGEPTVDALSLNLALDSLGAK
jgi:hypothetical protein